LDFGRSVKLLTRSEDSRGEVRGNVMPIRGLLSPRGQAKCYCCGEGFSEYVAVTIIDGAFEVASWQVGWKVWILNRAEGYTPQGAGHLSVAHSGSTGNANRCTHLLSTAEDSLTSLSITTCLLAISTPRTPQLAFPTSECLSSHLACGIVSILHDALFEHMVR